MLWCEITSCGTWCYFLFPRVVSEDDKGLSLLEAGIGQILLTKNKSSAENECRDPLVSILCIDWKKCCTLLLLSVMQSISHWYFPGKGKLLVSLLSTKFALLIAVWPSLNPIEFYLDTFLAAPLTAVSHLRLLMKCLPMWFFLSSTLKELQLMALLSRTTVYQSGVAKWWWPHEAVFQTDLLVLWPYGTKTNTTETKLQRGTAPTFRQWYFLLSTRYVGSCLSALR